MCIAYENSSSNQNLNGSNSFLHNQINTQQIISIYLRTSLSLTYNPRERKLFLFRFGAHDRRRPFLCAHGCPSPLWLHLVLKRESCPTLTKYSWVVQFISHRHLSSLKASFEIDLGPLDFNMVSELSLGFWANLPPIGVHVLIFMPQVRSRRLLRLSQAHWTLTLGVSLNSLVWVLLLPQICR